MWTKVFDLLVNIFEPAINALTTWTFVTVTLHASLGFKENKKGQWQRIYQPPVVVVVNRRREQVNIDGITLYFNNGKWTPLDLLLASGQVSKMTVDGRSNKTLQLKKEELLKLGPSGIMAMKYLLMTDATLQDYKFSVPRRQRSLIVRELYGQ